MARMAFRPNIVEELPRLEVGDIFEVEQIGQVPGSDDDDDGEERDALAGLGASFKAETLDQQRRSRALMALEEGLLDLSPDTAEVGDEV